MTEQISDGLDALAHKKEISVSSIVATAMDAVLISNPVTKRDIDKYLANKDKPPPKLKLKGIKLSGRAKEAVKLRNKKMSYAAIGKELGVSKQRAHELVRDATE